MTCSRKPAFDPSMHQNFLDGSRSLRHASACTTHTTTTCVHSHASAHLVCRHLLVALMQARRSMGARALVASAYLLQPHVPNAQGVNNTLRCLGLHSHCNCNQPTRTHHTMQTHNATPHTHASTRSNTGQEYMRDVP